MRTKHLIIAIDLDRIRDNAERIAATTRVPVIGVVKADAYGLGALRVTDALASVVSEFAYFYVGEAREVGRGGIVIGPPDGDAAEYRELGLRPSIASLEDARRFAGMRVAVNVDTGMQRFGCEPEQIDAIAAACDGPIEYHTHAATIDAIRKLRAACAHRGGRMLAASSSLIDQSEAWLDGVRPGVALYRGAMHVSTRLVGVRDLHGPAGYTRFEHKRAGIILGGYSNHLQSAPVLVNGRRQMLVEVGMNSAFVTIDARDRAGDEVVLLGDGLTEAEIARHLSIREHEVLCRYASAGNRVYSSHASNAASATSSADRSRMQA